ncbi:hypothetical protein JTB14_002430 [Gonioctena quinquepunctata]|nr:hypothetical protein JTB14_002430 [Gonioctena quinquepunctata]
MTYLETPSEEEFFRRFEMRMMMRKYLLKNTERSLLKNMSRNFVNILLTWNNASTQDDLRCMAYSLTTYINIPHMFNNRENMAGKDWVGGIKRMHPTIVSRTPESTPLARAQCFNKTNVTTFFVILETD